MLKIFSDSSYVPPGRGHIVMLYPFWGKNPEDPRDPNSGRFDRYTRIGRSFFHMVPLEEADIAVFPGAWEHVVGNPEALALAERFIERAGAAGKPTVLFFWSDSDEKVPYPDTIVFRTSLYRSRREPTEFAMPAWSEDFVEKWLGGSLPVRPKGKKPVVGFCGYAGPLRISLKKRVRRVLRWGAEIVGIREKVTPKPGPLLRAKALCLLSESPLVETNFIVREHFLGGALLPGGQEDLGLKQKVRLEYVRNMVESDYILCARGAGNFSYRLYETLSCGRIPIFIDTDCVLPYDFAIEWKDYCVWVDESELPLVAEKVAQLHDNLTAREFEELQCECRRLWEKWLSPQGFFANFYRHFQKNGG